MEEFYKDTVSIYGFNYELNFGNRVLSLLRIF